MPIPASQRKRCFDMGNRDRKFGIYSEIRVLGKTADDGRQTAKTGHGLWSMSLLLSLLVFAGCKSERDMFTDPAIAPVVVPLSMNFNDQVGSVVINWEYLGVEPVARYRLFRIDRDGIQLFDWVDASPSRREDERADVWPMVPVIDQKIGAGEFYTYAIQTENPREIPSEGFMGDIQIPGARLEHIAFREDGEARVSWHFASAPVRYELFRQVGDGPFESIFVSASSSDTAFVDRLSRGNVAYRYYLKNELDHGLVLNSRLLILSPFMHLRNFTAGIPAGARLVVAPSDAVNRSLLALVATPDAVSLRHVSVEGVGADPIGLSVPNRAEIAPASLSFGVMPFGHFIDPHLILAGVRRDAQRVQLSAFALRGNAMQPVAWEYADWPVDDPGATTAMGVGADGAIVVAAGQVLRAFAPSGQRIVDAGSVPLGLGSEVRSLAVAEFGVWAVTADGRVWRSAPVRLGQALAPPVWTEVTSNGDAAWVGAGPRAMFVLDRAQHRVTAFDAQGQAGLWWPLDALGGQADGLAISPFLGDVYAWNGQHQIALYHNAPPARLAFLGE